MVLDQGTLAHYHQICYFSMLVSRLIISYLLCFHSIVQQALLWLHSFMFSGSILLSFLKESVLAPKAAPKMLFSLLVFPPDGTFALLRVLTACF